MSEFSRRGREVGADGMQGGTIPASGYVDRLFDLVHDSKSLTVPENYFLSNGSRGGRRAGKSVFRRHE
ncbi:hypothetical protein NXW67_21295 [Bacteroides fragilis]|nr:hypothetical protein [Bacteroides fragilis]